jgi:hypothetical protein
VEQLPTSFIGTPAAIRKALIVLAAVVSLQQQPWRILFYGALWILFQMISTVIQKWLQFYGQDPEIIRCIRNVQGFFRRVVDEGNKALSGNYARRVVASYLIVSSAAPGESYIGKVIRYKTACLNQQILDQIDHSLHRFQLDGHCGSMCHDDDQ